jgi:hypothetical protein
MIKLPCPVCENVLEIPEQISYFACASCGTTLKVRRGGGIVSLDPVRGAPNPQAELRALESELEIATRQEIAGAPAYLLLRQEFLGLHKLLPWTAVFASDRAMQDIFNNLRMDELDKLILGYEQRCESTMATWLKKIRDLRERIARLKEQPSQEG